jgi:dihydroflavonol-4-reductase
MPITNTPILVTGATGFVAAEIVKQLLGADYRVRGTTRNVANAEAEGSLTELPGASERLELAEADLLDEDAYDEAVVGLEYVMHVASPFVLDVEDPQRDLLDPAVKGTLSVFESAVRAGGVKRIVLTSSFAAISGGTRDGSWSEADWNNTSTLESGSYAYSKTMAERAAWTFMEDRQPSFDLVVINPTGVIGPSIVGRVNQTHQVLIGATKGDYPGIINIEFPLVDVRDVATAHIRAMENHDASGRYLTSAKSASFRHMMDVARENGFGERYKLPTLGLDNPIGDVLVKLAATFQPKGTRDFLRSNVGKTYDLDTSKVQNELGVEFRDLDQSLAEALKDLERWGHLGK